MPVGSDIFTAGELGKACAPINCSSEFGSKSICFNLGFCEKAELQI